MERWACFRGELAASGVIDTLKNKNVRFVFITSAPDEKNDPSWINKLSAYAPNSPDGSVAGQSKTTRPGMMSTNIDCCPAWLRGEAKGDHQAP
jgi:hypothetical protein